MSSADVILCSPASASVISPLTSWIASAWTQFDYRYKEDIVACPTPTRSTLSIPSVIVTKKTRRRLSPRVVTPQQIGPCDDAKKTTVEDRCYHSQPHQHVRHAHTIRRVPASTLSGQTNPL
ncbi:hypothetical protein L226DRAFT_322127 [Lentinus tigrinus ALCF2SS1-7]|uniref:uncharacterized protein n=1 Tax=Lentinus tigrinus ALCF2SS1-7 TaxID=1328758 RepID=UPI001165FD58|nr:hypothetical protein L226DRAFT_322127 [Lentinus tigrinus ALCF2SS1-7]